jgi:chromate transport protein ChrA
MFDKFCDKKKNNIGLIVHLCVAIVLIFSLWYHNGFLILLIVIAFVIKHVLPYRNKNKAKVKKINKGKQK